jgi:hypothetical protein
VVKEPEITAAFNAIRKGGTVVITGMGSLSEAHYPAAQHRAGAVQEDDQGLVAVLSG